MSAIVGKKTKTKKKQGWWPLCAIAEKKKFKTKCKNSAAYVCHRPGCIAMPMQM